MMEVLARFAGVIVGGLVLTAIFLVVATDWRLSLGALALQYGLAAALLTQIVIWQVALVSLLVGLLVVAILALTGRQLNFGRRAGAARLEFPTNLPFRAAAALMVVVAAWSTALQPGFALPGLPPALNVASYVLLALGLLNLGLTEEPMNAGAGLLTALTGFGLLYAAVEQSLAVEALLAAVDFAVALAVSYLAILQYAAAGAAAGAAQEGPR